MIHLAGAASRRLWPLVGILLALFLGRPTQAHRTDTTGNRFVQAIVDDSTGYVWFISNGRPLSKYHRSFLSLQVQNASYSNMAPPPAYPDNDPAWWPNYRLFNGETYKIEDTLLTIWRDSLLDIIQEVYPVAFEKSGQIVLRVKVINHFGYKIAAQAQYIIDGYVAGHDSALTLTNYGYSSDWQYYDNTESPFPLTYSTFEHGLTALDPGLDATGYLMDAVTPFPLGLRQPAVFMVGDMHAAHPGYYDSTGRYIPPKPPLSLIYQTFGFWDPSLQVGPCTDNGYYIEWPQDTVSGTTADSVHELGRTSFGTGEFDLCHSADLTTLTFYPHRLKYDVGHNCYVNNPFLVETLVFNPSATRVLPDFSISQSVAGPLRIAQPQPTTKGGTAEVQTVAGINKLDVWESQWLDSAMHRNETTSDSLAYLTLNTSIGAGFTPACDLVTTIEGARHDTIPPAMRLTSTHGSYNGQACQTKRYALLALDTGGTDPLQRGSAVSGLASVQLASGAINMHLEYKPFAGGPDSVAFALAVTDSLFDGAATVVVKDRAGNAITRDFTYCTIHDIAPPFVTFDTLADGAIVRVHDDRPWDRGLAGLAVLDSTNCSFYWSTLIGFTPVYAFRVRHTDPTKPLTLTLTAKDEAGNWGGVFSLTVPPVAVVEPGRSAALMVEAYPNPASGALRLRLTGASTGHARLLDLLGREVMSSSLTDDGSLDLSALPSGPYVIEVTTPVGLVRTRVVKE